jgi:hypothetical protein
MVRLFIFFFIASINVVIAQVNCSEENLSALKAKLKYFTNPKFKSLDRGNLAVEVGKSFLDVPYVSKTLDKGEKENLVINLKELDCTTFLENVVVITRLIKQGEITYDTYIKELEYLRYRDGKRDGYVSRLHYFSEWIKNNEKKNILKDITQEIGGEQYPNKINFMSTHPQYYPQLANNNELDKIKVIESTLSGQEFYYIKKESLKNHVSSIKNGDLIAITTSIKGLDIVHVGFATWKGDKLHLLHATTDQDKVEISPIPLADRLLKHKNQTGIIVMRLKNN